MTQHFAPPRRMKRSRNLVMTALMAGGASVSLAACGDGHDAAACRYDDRAPHRYFAGAENVTLAPAPPLPTD
jgi:hypothetical protein